MIHNDSWLRSDGNINSSPTLSPPDFVATSQNHQVMMMTEKNDNNNCTQHKQVTK